MFSVSSHILMRDALVILACLGITSLISAIYLFFCLKNERKVKAELSISALWKKKKNDVLIQYGMPAFFCFLGAYGCRFIVVKILFAFAYTFFVCKIFTHKKNNN